MDRRRGCEAQVHGGKALARSDRPRTGTASRIGFDKGQRTKFVPGLSPPSTKTRQHRPWPSRDGPHRLDTAAETPFFPISSLLDGSLQTRVLKCTAGAGAPATEPQYRSGHRL